MSGSIDVSRPGLSQLKAQLDQRFDLRVRFEDYHHARLEDYWKTDPSKPSETANASRALYEVATSLHRVITSWTKEVSFAPGDENDPQTFWDLAQPEQDLTEEVMIDILQTHKFTCGPAPYVPGLIDIYVRLIQDPRFLKTPQVRLCVSIQVSLSHHDDARSLSIVCCGASGLCSSLPAAIPKASSLVQRRQVLRT